MNRHPIQCSHVGRTDHLIRQSEHQRLGLTMSFPRRDLLRVASLLCGVFLPWFFFFAETSRAQSIELYGGYSFVRAPVTFTQTILCPVPSCPSSPNTHTLNMNGWEAGGAFKFIGPLSLAADFSGTSGSLSGANAHLQTYLVGPQVRFPGPISPFAHFLFGAAHEAISAGGPTQNAFATAIGGGIDLKLLPFISVRPIQFDYLLTRFNSSNQHQPRVSAGIVLRF